MSDNDTFNITPADPPAADQEDSERKLAKWERMLAYQGRMTATQRRRLDTLASQLQVAASVAHKRNPRLRTERITVNTLLRVAIEILLPIGGKLEGHTERQLVQSAKQILGLAKTLEEPDDSDNEEPPASPQDPPSWQ